MNTTHSFREPDPTSLDVTALRDLVRLAERFEAAWRGTNHEVKGR